MSLGTGSVAAFCEGMGWGQVSSISMPQELLQEKAQESMEREGGELFVNCSHLIRLKRQDVFSVS